MARLDGKMALVFGGDPNIGGTIAHFMAREGAKVAVSDLLPAGSNRPCSFSGLS